MDKYEKIESIGKGAVGMVYKARNILTNNIVAIKRIGQDFVDCCTVSTTREVSILMGLKHENIVRLLEVVRGKKHIYLVFEYLEMDLKNYIKLNPKHAENPVVIKGLLRQILLGVSYCHSHRVLHRDLKPQNLLLNCETKSLKIADFGLAKALGIHVRVLTPEVMTGHYKAPEILLESPRYTSAIDIWSVGCIFAELATGQVLFCGNSDSEQLLKIFSIMGTPDEESWPGVTSLPGFSDRFLPGGTDVFLAKNFADVVPNLDARGCDLLTRMLFLDPSKRITAEKALDHNYFDDHV